MKRFSARAVALVGLVTGSLALAQQPQPSLPQSRISSVFPVGAKAGTTLEITVNGVDLDDATGLLFSHPGISATIVAPPDMTDPKKTDPKAKNPGMGKKGPPPTSVKFTVTVAPNVPVGGYDVRIVNRFGASNPRLFVVGDRPETVEMEPNDDANPGNRAVLAGGPSTLPKSTPRAQRVELGTVIHGVIGTPTDVDYSVFAGKANQRVLISCQTSSIDSKARPLVELYDANGKRLGLNRNYQANDALLDVTLPADGDYFVRVSEFAYQQGGPDFYYRLTIGAGPWIDAIHPPMINPGKPTQVTLFGRGLPNGQAVPGMTIDGRPVESLAVTITPPADPNSRTALAVAGRISPPMGLQDGFEYRLITPNGSSNAVPVYFTDAKIHLEKEGNDKAETPESIAVPCDVAGRIDKKFDRDFYSFDAKKGDTFIIEVLADRIGSAADVYLRVRGDKGQELAGELDDDPESLHPITFFSRSTDPQSYKFTAAADGKYTILVGSIDANVNFGPKCFYRLRVSAPTPDFRAVVMARSKDQPATLTGNPEGDFGYDVFIARQDNFTGPVTVTAEGLPGGVTAKPALIGTGMKWGTLVLSADANAKEFTGPITLKCTASIDGKPVVRTARPATITWGVQQQQNQPTVTRLDQQLVFAVRPDKALYRLTADLANISVKTKDKDGKDVDTKVNGPLFVKPGDKITIPVKVAWQDKEARANPINVAAEPTMQNMQNAPITVNNNQPVAIPKEKNDGTVTVDVRSSASSGTYALVLRGDTQIQYVRDPNQKDKKNPATVFAFIPPIEVTILPTSLAKLTLTPPPSIKAGASGELLVKVERQADYAGEYKVKVELPKDTKGVTVAEAVIPAGKDEVKMSIAIAADVKPGNLQNLIVVATGTIHGKFAIPQDAKFNLTIAKDK